MTQFQNKVSGTAAVNDSQLNLFLARRLESDLRIDSETKRNLAVVLSDGRVETIETGDVSAKMQLLRTANDQTSFVTIHISGRAKNGTFYIDLSGGQENARDCGVVFQGDVSPADLTEILDFKLEQTRAFSLGLAENIARGDLWQLIMETPDQEIISLEEREPDLSECLERLFESEFIELTDIELNSIRDGLMRMLVDPEACNILFVHMLTLSPDAGDMDPEFMDRIIKQGLADFSQSELQQLLGHRSDLRSLWGTIQNETLTKEGTTPWTPYVEAFLEQTGRNLALLGITPPPPPRLPGDTEE